MTIALEVKSLSKNFGGLKAIDDMSFSLDDGGFTALIGPNGAGKTTCFNLLSGVLEPSAGDMLLHGQSITSMPTHLRARQGMGRTFQIAATFRSMTVLENIEVALIAAKQDKLDATGLLDELGIAEHTDHIITELAYGDIKRVELAMALASMPSVLLLDEPTAGMGANERLSIMELIARLARVRGTTVLFTEHDMDSVFGFAERILVMDQGQLIADGSPEDIRSNTHVQQIYLGDEATLDA